jgi:Flp pilus assembly pilin Flp
MYRFARNATRIIEYGVLGAIMAASIATAVALVKSNLAGPFDILGAAFEQQGQVLKVAPASSPAVQGRIRSPRSVSSILPWADVLP